MRWVLCLFVVCGAFCLCALDLLFGVGSAISFASLSVVPVLVLHDLFGVFSERGGWIMTSYGAVLVVVVVVVVVNADIIPFLLIQTTLHKLGEVYLQLIKQERKKQSRS